MRAPLSPQGSIESAVDLSRRIRHDGGTVVLTHGVFDLLHPGHVRYLQAARRLGAALVVGVHSDRWVRARKGPERPINPERERAEVLSALGCVDLAVVFDDETAHALVGHVEPDVLVHGSNRESDQSVERDLVEARGGRVVRMAPIEGFSTSGLIARPRARGTP